VDNRARAAKPYYLLSFSGKCEESLRGRLEEFRRWIAANSSADIRDISYTLGACREHFDLRAALVVRSTDEIADKIDAILKGRKIETAMANWDKSKVSTTDPVMKKLLRSTIEGLSKENYKEDLLAIAGLYLQGHEVSWEVLFKNEEVKKIPLPTYVFKKTRYWVEGEQVKTARKINIPQPVTSQLLYYQPSWMAQPITNPMPSTITEVTLLGDNLQPLADESIKVSTDYDEKIKHIIYHVAAEKFVDTESVREGAIVKFMLFVQRLLQAEQEHRIIVSYDHNYPQLGGLLGGFARAVNSEQKRIHLKAVGNDKNDLKQLIGEFNSDNIESKYIGDQRYIRELTAVSSVSEGSSSFIQKGDVILITGGLGGLGFAFAKYLAENYQAKLVLMGRSSLDAKKAEQLEEISKLGGEAIYQVGDVVNQQDLQLIKQVVEEKYGRLDGVLHAAGAVDICSLKNKKEINILKTLAPKVLGLQNISEILGKEVRYVISFSSISSKGILADGLSDYGAANGFMDGYVEGKKKNNGTKYININWPFWMEGGMVSADSELEKYQAQRFAQVGLVPMPTSIGMEAFAHIMQSGNCETVVLYGDKAKLKHLAQLNKGKKVVQVDVVNASITEKLEEDIARIAGDILRLEIGKIERSQPIGQYGFDSITLTEYSTKLNSRYNVTLTPAVFFEYDTIEGLARYLLSVYPQELAEFYGQAPKEVKLQEVEEVEVQEVKEVKVQAHITASKVGDVAIIGMAGIFPGGDLWSNLEAKKELIREIPIERWDHAQYPDVAKWGGFIDDIDKFDAEFFRISPREAELMDPQQRLLLQVIYQAVENAGYNLKAFGSEKCKTGLFVGACNADYIMLIERSGIEDAHISTGVSHSILANRVSYLYDFSGPSESVDTACSSSLVALHNAVKSLQHGESDIAIAGGVNALLAVGGYISLTKAGMLSPNGRCKSFDKDANGFVRGEGIGAIILKPLVRAEEDGDHIYGVIKASGTNHGGTVNTLTAPNPNAQAQLIIDTYRKAGIEPSSVSYIECQGTGTPLGDPIEINGLKKAFAELGDKQVAHCGIGTIKGNIGHLEGSAGIAAVIKVLLSLQHKKLPGLATFTEINPYIQIENSPFYLVKDTQEWKSQGSRRLGVNSYGFGGTNAHVVIEEYVAPVDSRAPANMPYYLLSFSGKCEESLKGRLEEFKQWIAANTSTDIRDISYTLGACREHFDLRAALVVRSTDEIADKIDAILKGRTIETAMVNWDKSKVVATSPSMKKLLKNTIAELQSKTLREEYRDDLLTVADLYVQGHEVTWHSLFKSEAVKKIPLPTYVFKKTRYWVEDSSMPKFISSNLNKLHPMLDENISTIKEQSFRKTLSMRDFYIKDHLIAGNYLLPGVAFLEMARAAGNLASGQIVTSIENVVWSRPVIVVDEVEVQVKLYPEYDDLSYEIVNSEGNKYSQGILKFGTVAAEKMEVPQVIGEKIAKDDLYKKFKTLGFAYGERFQVLEWVTVIGEGKLLARLINPDKTAGYVLHPSMLDATLQVLLATATGTSTVIPFSAGKFEILTNTPNEGYVYVDSGTLRLMDNDGNVAVKINDFIGREIKSANEESELLYYKFNWQTKALEGEARSDYIIYKADHDIVKLFELVKGGIEKDLFVTYPSADISLGEMLGGFAKTLNLEQSKYRVYVVGVENEEQIQAEIKYTTTDIEVRYQGGERHVKVPQEASASVQEMPIKQQDIILITGDQGGLGRIFADYLAEKYAAKVILMGRSAAKDDKYEYIQADIADAKTLANLPKIDGVIHAAGIIRDNFIGKKTVEEFKSVLSPKIDGLKNIAEIIKPKYCILFSSIASSLGNAGQSDYAAANGFMDGYAAQYANYYAINWPLWVAGGMHIDGTAEELMATQGLQLLPTPEGIRAFEQALAYGGATVLYGKRSKLQRLVNPVRRIVKSNTGALSTEVIEKFERDVLQMVSAILKIDATQVDKQKNISNYGFESITLTEFANAINKQYKLKINPSLFFEYNNITMIAEYLASQSIEESTEQPENKSKLMPKTRRFSELPVNTSVKTGMVNDIAIIGMAGLMPNSNSLEDFWQKLKAQTDFSDEVPAERWDWRQHPESIKRGYFIADIDKFDAGFFNINPREAMLMDPQQRLLLQTVYHAIEDSGYVPSYFAAKQCKTSIFVGVMTQDYSHMVTQAGIDEPYVLSGVPNSFLANSISYRYNFNGASESIDTACSSSLVAVHHAVKALQNGESDVAIAAGVNAILNPRSSVSLMKGGILSKNGISKSFDKSADGYGRGEGIGVIILKPLAKAETDGDRIYGVIKASGTNHGGAGNSMTAPNPHGQIALLMDVYRKYNIDTSTISYIECQATGTPLGDAIEVNSLKKAFSDLGDHNIGHCGLGTVKSNIGHLEGCAGISGLIKVLLSLQHKQLPGLATLEEVNPYIELEKSPFYLVKETQEWRSQGLRRAGVSGFGLGGTNAHVVVEEYVPPVDSRSPASKPYYLLSFSGKREESLRGRLEEFKQWIAANTGADIRDISYTLGACREHFDLRAALVVSGTNEISDKIDAILEGRCLETAIVNWDKTKIMATSPVLRKTLETTINTLKDSMPREEYKNNLTLIADLYTQGYEVIWKSLFKSEEVKRISLPNYVFKKERYWIDSKPSLVEIRTENKDNFLKELRHSQNDDDIEVNVLHCIQQIWSDNLGIPIEKIDIQDSLFNLGGGSLLAVHLASMVSKKLGILLTASDILQYPTIASLADYIESQGKEEQILIQKQEVKSPEQQRLSFAQERLWFIEKYVGESVAYNLPFIGKLKDNIDIQCLKQALYSIVARHEVLRTLIKEDEQGQAYQFILPDNPCPLVIQEINLAQEDELVTHLTRDANTVYQLDRELPLKVKIYQVANVK